MIIIISIIHYILTSFNYNFYKKGHPVWDAYDLVAFQTYMLKGSFIKEIELSHKILEKKIFMGLFLIVL